jgi:hypothetical protein
VEDKYHQGFKHGLDGKEKVGFLDFDNSKEYAAGIKDGYTEHIRREPKVPGGESSETDESYPVAKFLGVLLLLCFTIPIIVGIGNTVNRNNENRSQKNHESDEANNQPRDYKHSDWYTNYGKGHDTLCFLDNVYVEFDPKGQSIIVNVNGIQNNRFDGESGKLMIGVLMWKRMKDIKGEFTCEYQSKLKELPARHTRGAFYISYPVENEIKHGGLVTVVLSEYGKNGYKVADSREVYLKWR